MSRSASPSDHHADIALACIGLALADMVERLSQRATLDEFLEMMEGVHIDAVPVPCRTTVMKADDDAYANHQGQRLRVVR